METIETPFKEDQKRQSDSDEEMCISLNMRIAQSKYVSEKVQMKTVLMVKSDMKLAKQLSMPFSSYLTDYRRLYNVVSVRCPSFSDTTSLFASTFAMRPTVYEALLNLAETKEQEYGAGIEAQMSNNYHCLLVKPKHAMSKFILEDANSKSHIYQVTN